MKKTSEAKEKAVSDLAQEIAEKKKESMHILADAIWSNTEYKAQLEQRFKTLNKGSGRPTFICGYDEHGAWIKSLAHIVSDTEAAKFWTRLVKASGHSGEN